uniref:Uncharacterized protein n=1 Tax=Picea sitchensis TaxID=3332 RepID=A9NRN3_PICSI|nr:unknown [Picea sitchensis]
MGQNMGRGVNRNEQGAAWSPGYDRGRRPNMVSYAYS